MDSLSEDESNSGQKLKIGPTTTQPFPQITTLRGEWSPKEVFERDCDMAMPGLTNTYETFLKEHTELFEGRGITLPTEQESKELGEYCSYIIIGAHMVFERLGVESSKRMVDVTFGPNNSVVAVTGEIGNLQYQIDPIKLLSIARLSRLGQSHYPTRFPVVHGKKEYTLKDLFLLAGVEEAAHYMFHTYKPNYDEDDQKELKEIDYNATDIESSAIVWQVAFIKKYLPHLYDDVIAYQNQVRSIRSEFFNRQNKDTADTDTAS